MESVMKLLKLILTVTLIIAGAFILPACTVKPTPPSFPGSLTMKISPATDVHIVHASARQDGENVVVEGQITRKKIGGRGIVKGHVDIEIIDNEGKAIRQVVTDFSPRIVPKFSGMKSTFSTKIPIIAPPGSVVSVRFHNGQHES
jgi:hypothetical protein